MRRIRVEPVDWRQHSQEKKRIKQPDGTMDDFQLRPIDVTHTINAANGQSKTYTAQQQQQQQQQLKQKSTRF